ncbi:unnamed protein product, partial [Vitis vinifera]
MHELSEAFHAISLRHTCLLSILEQFSKLSSRAGELNLQVEAERSYHQTVLATLEKLFDEVCNYTSCFVFILRQIMYCSS